MEDNDFKKSLKVPESESSNHNPQLDAPSTEALYLYTNNSLDEIFYFLRDFYIKNPTQDMLESDYVKSSHAESYYYSLGFEFSHAYSNFLDGKLSIENFKKQFNNICSHYKTNPLEIFETHNLVIEAKENPTQNDFNSLVNSIESQVDVCWEKMKADKENQNQIEKS